MSPNPYRPIMNAINEHCIKICNSLLRGELSAIQTYGQAIHKYPDSAVTDELRSIRSDHIKAANLLSDHVRDMAGDPETDSGAWGSFATTVQGAANLFGTNSAVESLQKGEEMGRKDYESALVDDEVMPESKALIREKLLPPTVRHIAALESLEQLA